MRRKPYRLLPPGSQEVNTPRIQLNLTTGDPRPANGARSKVPFLLAPTDCKISTMDDAANPHQADKIARAYLKQLRQQRAGIGEKTQKAGLQAWHELEERLNLGTAQNEPNEAKLPTPSRTSAIKKAKKAQSIWKRPISELWRRQRT